MRACIDALTYTLGQPPLHVEDGVYGPVATVVIRPERGLLAAVVDGILMVQTQRPGVGIYFGLESTDGDTIEWVNDYLAWQATESDAELRELGVVETTTTARVPEQRVLRGTLMTVAEAMLGGFPENEETEQMLTVGYAEPPSPEEVWLLLVGVE